ncbi:MAG: hypothetical protein ACPGYT_13935 [Nitrospirales bacterium]
MSQHNRPLTYDERKAAEAAFQGLPCDPKWSHAAQTVYAGISSAMENKQNEVILENRLLETMAMAK